MTQCDECKKDIVDTAMKCFYCGSKTRLGKRKDAEIMAGILVVFATVLSVVRWTILTGLEIPGIYLSMLTAFIVFCFILGIVIFVTRKVF